MKVLCKVTVLWCLLLLTSSDAVAWSGREHKIIARIAWENLTPQARAAVIELLSHAPADSTIKTYFPSDISGRNAQREFFINISVWADQVRDPSDLERGRKYSCPRWHFTEFPLAAPGATIPAIPGFTQQRVNIVERLQLFQVALADDSEPVSNQAIELAWTINLAGDIHDPLHVTSRVTPEEPEGDRGGNTFKLAHSNLHAYWDQIVTTLIPIGPNESESNYILRVANTLMEEHPRNSMELKPGRFDAWAQESFELAQTVVYPGVERLRDPSPFYELRAFCIAKSQLALAGYRLAQMLNDLFGSPRTKPRNPPFSADIQDLKVRLDYDLACVAATFEDKVKDLRIVRGMVTEGEGLGQQVEGFDLNQVNELLQNTKSELLKALAGEDLAGMRAYVDKHFPTGAELQVIKVETIARRTSLPGIDSRPPPYLTPISWTNTGNRWLAPFKAVVKVVDTAWDKIGSLRQRGKPIKLTLVTTPVDGANIKLQAPGGKEYAQSTNSAIGGFWPGTYTITVSKDGFVTIVHPNIDLGFDNSVVECRLVTSGTPILCQIR
jgi:hypothetical protein